MRWDIWSYFESCFRLNRELFKVPGLPQMQINMLLQIFVEIAGDVI